LSPRPDAKVVGKLMSSDQPVSLRERKKLMTRQAMIEAAEELFVERGFDNVTVAEIADRVNVAPKTVFVYFSSKEDLVFHDEDVLRENLTALVRDRAVGETPLDAVVGFLRRLLAESTGPVADLERIQSIVGDSPVLQSRMRLMWENLENSIAEQLARETGEPRHAPRPRVAAAQVILIFRMLASAQVREFLRSYPEAQRREAYRQWMDVAELQVRGGIAGYSMRLD
jgi:AcrR family transcriptional regulator